MLGNNKLNSNRCMHAFANHSNWTMVNGGAMHLKSNRVSHHTHSQRLAGLTGIRYYTATKLGPRRIHILLGKHTRDDLIRTVHIRRVEM